MSLPVRRSEAYDIQSKASALASTQHQPPETPSEQQPARQQPHPPDSPFHDRYAIDLLA